MKEKDNLKEIKEILDNFLNKIVTDNKEVTKNNLIKAFKEKQIAFTPCIPLQERAIKLAIIAKTLGADEDSSFRDEFVKKLHCLIAASYIFDDCFTEFADVTATLAVTASLKQCRKVIFEQMTKMLNLFLMKNGSTPKDFINFASPEVLDTMGGYIIDFAEYSEIIFSKMLQGINKDKIIYKLKNIK